MRTIKFRAWDIYKKVFIPTDVWALVQVDFGAFGIMLKDWEDYKEGEYFYSYTQTLSEFTGLKDINGVEIYEGDILTINNKYPRKIEWFNNGFWAAQINSENKFPLTMLGMITGLSDYEVIGNIFEHKHLLNI